MFLDGPDAAYNEIRYPKILSSRVTNTRPRTEPARARRLHDIRVFIIPAGDIYTFKIRFFVNGGRCRRRPGNTRTRTPGTTARKYNIIIITTTMMHSRTFEEVYRSEVEWKRQKKKNK